MHDIGSCVLNMVKPIELLAFWNCYSHAFEFLSKSKLLILQTLSKKPFYNQLVDCNFLQVFSQRLLEQDMSTGHPLLLYLLKLYYPLDRELKMRIHLVRICPNISIYLFQMVSLLNKFFLLLLEQ